MSLIFCDERSKRIKNCEFTVLKRKHALPEFAAPIVASESGVKVAPRVPITFQKVAILLRFRIYQPDKALSCL